MTLSLIFQFNNRFTIVAITVIGDFVAVFTLMFTFRCRIQAAVTGGSWSGDVMLTRQDGIRTATLENKT